MSKTYAVFSDRCNFAYRHLDGLTEEEAEAKATELGKQQGWPCYVAPSEWDGSFDPFEGMTQEEINELYAAMENPE